MKNTEKNSNAKLKPANECKNIDLTPFAALICEKFEDLLEKHDITIPDDSREGEAEEARIYGDTYYTLEEEVMSVLELLVKELRESEV